MAQTGGIALYGGSFNPIHMGHLISARAVYEQLRLKSLIFVPSATPPHKLGHTDLADAADRLKMVRLAIAGEPGFDVSDVELRRSGPSYTILTVSEFRASLAAGTPLHWIIGGDSIPELATWYRIRELVDLCQVITVVRPGYETPDLSALEAVLSPQQMHRILEGILPTPRIDISATGIRRRIREHRPVRYLVPEAVEEYIHQHDLYRS